MERRNLRPKRQLSPAVPSDVAPPVKKMQKDYSKAYRDRVKDNPGLYKLVRAEETRRNQEYRKNRSHEAVLRNRELQKLRQRRYREKLKERQQKEKRAPKTQRTLEQKRNQRAEEKRVHKANMSHQKRAAINRKRREACAAKKKAPPSPQPGTSLQQPTSTTPTLDLQQPDLSLAPQPGTSASCSSSSRNAVRTAKTRFKKFLHSLPSNPNMRAEIISACLQTLSPTSKRCINAKLGILSPKAKCQLEFGFQISNAVKERTCLLYTSPSPRDRTTSRMPSSA